MVKLEDFVRKEVKIVFNDGDVITGFVTSTDSIERDEDEDEVEAITLEDTGIHKYLLVTIDEIKSIEVIE